MRDVVHGSTASAAWFIMKSLQDEDSEPRKSPYQKKGLIRISRDQVAHNLSSKRKKSRITQRKSRRRNR